MAKNEYNKEAIERYANIIASIANAAISKTEGINKDLGLAKNTFGLSTLKDRNVSVYFDDENMVNVDMYVSVSFGFCVPEVVCLLQERIKTEVEEATRFKVRKINVNVTTVTFD